MGLSRCSLKIPSGCPCFDRSSSSFGSSACLPSLGGSAVAHIGRYYGSLQVAPPGRGTCDPFQPSSLLRDQMIFNGKRSTTSFQIQCYIYKPYLWGMYHLCESVINPCHNMKQISSQALKSVPNTQLIHPCLTECLAPEELWSSNLSWQPSFHGSSNVRIHGSSMMKSRSINVFKKAAS